MREDLVSVIVPVYNSQKYLGKCLTSILKQTYRTIEVLLVDDGSTDQCGTLCEEYAMTDPRIRVIHQKNQGVAAARNTGLDRAKGDFVLFVDSDDWLELEMIENMIAVEKETNSDIVVCDCQKDRETGSELYTHPYRSGFYDFSSIEKEYFPELLITKNIEYPLTISNCVLLYRFSGKRKAVRYLPGIRYSEDWLFGAELMLYSDSFYYMKNEAYYHYNLQNTDSATHRPALDKWKDYKELYRVMQERFAVSNRFDFSSQLDRVLLFFVWNGVGEVLKNSDLQVGTRKEIAQTILRDETVIKMFSKINICTLPVSSKQKLLTWLYKENAGIGYLARYFNRVQN